MIGSELDIKTGVSIDKICFYSCGLVKLTVSICQLLRTGLEVRGHSNNSPDCGEYPIVSLAFENTDERQDGKGGRCH